ncbi:MAG: NAD(P)H-hydrate epimerase [Cyclobacteriaceae bacterium]
MIKNTHLNYPESKALELKDFKEMDYYAVTNFNLPIELMMENAGLQLANLIANDAYRTDVIKIGIGNGNNGGGGLVAARRLLAWGYTVHLDLFTDISKELPKKQLERAMRFGAKESSTDRFDLWVDAYLGFSQRLPLSEALLERLETANESNAMKISLDIPTGFAGDPKATYFECDKVLTLAAPKKILYQLPKSTKIFIADIGIPSSVYEKFEVDPLPFHTSNILKLQR